VGIKNIQERGGFILHKGAQWSELVPGGRHRQHDGPADGYQAEGAQGDGGARSAVWTHLDTCHLSHFLRSIFSHIIN
jgi:hypothetical protein